MPLSHLPEVLFILAELLEFDDVASLASTSVSTLRKLETVNHILRSASFKGIELLGWRPFSGALFQQIRDTLQPQSLFEAAHCQCNPAYNTTLIPVTFDTSGTYFVRFRFWCHASQGFACMGVADAAAVRSGSMQMSSETFTMFCDPLTGKLNACFPSKLPKHVMGDLPKEGTSSKTCWTAQVVGWDSCEKAANDSDDFPVGFGMLISNGTLEFIRQGPHIRESSGVVLDQLPARVVCCASLFNFVGEACVTLEEVVSNELPSCIQNRIFDCGKVSPWSMWESVPLEEA